MLSNLKLYILAIAIIGASSLNVLQRYQVIKLDGQLQVCQANAAAQQVAINLAKQLELDRERQLKLREQEAAKAQAESLKRKDFVMQSQINTDCKSVNDWMIQQAQYYFQINN